VTALLIALILALTGLFRIESPTLNSLAELRAHEVAVGGLEHRYLSELNNGEWSAWGEVLEWNRGFDDPAQAAVNGWAGSPEHRAFLFNANYTHIGCGSEYRETDSEAASSGWYFVCILARPTSVTVTPGTTSVLPDAAMQEESFFLWVIIVASTVLLVKMHRRPQTTKVADR
jgi:hypothetical protein